MPKHDSVASRLATLRPEEFAPRAAPGDALQVAGGPWYLCIQAFDASIRCGGSEAELQDVRVAGKAKRMAATEFGGCVPVEQGPVHCWDAGAAAQAVPGTSHAAAVARGIDFACALSHAGTVSCWGENEAGTLGDGATSSRKDARPVNGLSEVVQLVAGRSFACALRHVGTVHCWGLGDDGQLGDGIERGIDTFSKRPVQVAGLSGVEAITAGHAHACALTGGTLSCWGANSVGQLGDGTTERARFAPVKVKGLDSVLEVVGGGGHTCALSEDESIWCWGNSTFGQTGHGLRTAASTPRRVDLR